MFMKNCLLETKYRRHVFVILQNFSLLFWRNQLARFSVLYKFNRIYHHVARGTRESHPSVQDLQSTTRLAESWMLQILDRRMGFPSPPRNVEIDYFSSTCKMCKIKNEKAINNVDFDHLLDILASTSCDGIITYVTSQWSWRLKLRVCKMNCT